MVLALCVYVCVTSLHAAKGVTGLDGYISTSFTVKSQRFQLTDFSKIASFSKLERFLLIFGLLASMLMHVCLPGVHMTTILRAVPAQ